jgi:diacylglycerol kinase (ATP)
MASPAFVLINPHAAGGRAAALIEPVRQWLASYAPESALVEADSVARSRAMLQCLPLGSRVVLIGGDGTVHHMLPVLLAHRFTLGLVPMGSGNDTARALGVHGLTWVQALTHALNAPASVMDTGEFIVERRRVPFISSLAVGFDAAVGARVALAPQRLTGMPRYLWATLAELKGLRNWPVKITVDGTLRHQGRALFASVLNTASYGSGMPAVPHARIDDGKLDLLVAGRFGRLGTAMMLPRLLAGAHLGHRRVASMPFTRVLIECASELPIAADGEAQPPEREFEVKVRRASLSVVKGPSQR